MKFGGEARRNQRLGMVNQKSFEYVAVAANGTRHKGTMQAGTAAAVSAALQADGWMPLTVTELTSRGLQTDLTSLVGGGEARIRLTVPEAALLFRQMAELLRAGVALTFILQAISEEASPKVRQICDALLERVTAGVPLSEAMAQFPDAFDPIVRAYIASGETAGTLPETMARLARTLEKRNAMRLKIKGVTAYPKFVGIAIGLIVTAIILFMVPTYERIYQDFGSKLPGPTRALVSLSHNLLPVSFKWTFPMPFFFAEIDWSVLGLLGRFMFAIGFVMATEALRNRTGRDPTMRRNIIKWAFIIGTTLFAGEYSLRPYSFLLWFAILAPVLAVRFLSQLKSDDDRTARLVDTIRFKMPLMGKITRRNCLYQWSSTLSGALSSGIPMGQALTLAASTSGSRWYMAAARTIREGVMAGRPLSEALGDHPDLYTSQVRALVTTGEMIGEMGPMLDSVATSTEGEIDTLIAGLSAKVEVALLVVMGIVVGGLLIALYMPIINLAATVSNEGN